MSRLPANDMGDNEIIPGAVHRSPEIYFTGDENASKPRPGNCLMKAERLVIASKKYGRIAQQVREEERRKGRDLV